MALQIQARGSATESEHGGYSNHYTRFRQTRSSASVRNVSVTYGSSDVTLGITARDRTLWEKEGGSAMKHVKILFLLLPAVLMAPMISANPHMLGSGTFTPASPPTILDTRVADGN